MSALMAAEDSDGADSHCIEHCYRTVPRRALVALAGLALAAHRAVVAAGPVIIYSTPAAEKPPLQLSGVD